MRERCSLADCGLEQSAVGHVHRKGDDVCDQRHRVLRASARLHVRLRLCRRRDVAFLSAFAAPRVLAVADVAGVAQQKPGRLLPLDTPRAVRDKGEGEDRTWELTRRCLQGTPHKLVRSAELVC